MKRRPTSHKTDRGFSLVELLIAVTVSLIVIGAGFTAFKKATDVSTIALNRAEMQANARVAINSIARDLAEAGAGGFPYGGVGLPNGATPFFARDNAGNNYLNNNTYAQDVLYAVTPAFNAGPTIDGITTDGITLVYVDQSLFSAPCSNWSTTFVSSLTPNGSQITMPATLCPALNDPVYGLRVGDMMIATAASNGRSAVGEITSLPSTNNIDFTAPDFLGMNLPTAASGNIASLANPAPPPGTPGPPAGYPPVQIARILMISYFIEALDANGNAIPLLGPGIAAPNAVDYRLMRMVNSDPPVPVAEHIVNLKFSYDLMSTAGAETSANPSAVVAGVPVFANIRNVYVSVTSRSPHPLGANVSGTGYTYSTMFTNVSPRNLSFKNRYN